MIGALVVGALGVAGKMASGVMSARARRGEFDQAIRSVSMKRDQVVATAKARAAAMGSEIGSLDTTNYLGRLRSEFDLEIHGLKKSRNQTHMAQLMSTLFGGAADAASLLSSYGAATNHGQQPGVPDLLSKPADLWSPPSFGGP